MTAGGTAKQPAEMAILETTVNATASLAATFEIPYTSPLSLSYTLIPVEISAFLIAAVFRAPAKATAPNGTSADATAATRGYKFY